MEIQPIHSRVYNALIWFCRFYSIVYTLSYLKQIWTSYTSKQLNSPRSRFLMKTCVCMFADYSFVFKTLFNDKNKLWHYSRRRFVPRKRNDEQSACSTLLSVPFATFTGLIFSSYKHILPVIRKINNKAYLYTICTHTHTFYAYISFIIVRGTKWSMFSII